MSEGRKREMTEDPVGKFLSGIEGEQILGEVEYGPTSLSVDEVEVRLRCLELALRYGRPMVGDSEVNPIVSREKIRILARFLEEYVRNG